MKNFHRDHPQFSQCGLNCMLCPMNLGGHCPGCGGGAGNQSCAIARCTIEQGIGDFCTQCGQFPCGRYKKMMDYDSFLPHSRMIRDLRRAEELGIEGYIAQLEERKVILNQLLDNWNDGRRKGFYCIAVYLLELNDLRCAFDEIKRGVPAEKSVKEKSITAVEILKKTAEANGITLKLNKTPKEK